jgi:hypothetical protein
LKLGEILREVFLPHSGSRYEERLSALREQNARVNRCLMILEENTMSSIRQATEEAAKFNDHGS